MRPALTCLLMILLLLSTAWATPVYRAYPDYGVEVVGLGLAAAGYMIDFRYRVVDPVKAAPMFDRRVKPWCEVAKSGARLMVPAPAKTGPLRQVGRKVKPGSQLFIMFANPGRHVQRGDKVTIVVGDYRFADLVVQ